MNGIILLLGLGLSSSTFAQTPDIAAETAQPRETRGGTLRFTAAELADPAVAPVFLARLAEDEPTAVRVALVAALPRTKGDWETALVDLLETETEQEVRTVMIEVLRHAGAEAGAAGLGLGARDQASAVREATMRTAGYLGQRVDLQPLLQEGLRDESSAVRAAAARSCGSLHLDGSWDTLAGLLLDSDPAVRLQALRALERIDPSATATLPALATLQADPDDRIARTARQLLDTPPGPETP